MVDWFPDLRRRRAQSHKFTSKEGLPTFPFYFFHDSPNGGQPSVGDAGHADCGSTFQFCHPETFFILMNTL